MISGKKPVFGCHALNPQTDCLNRSISSLLSMASDHAIGSVQPCFSDAWAEKIGILVGDVVIEENILAESLIEELKRSKHYRLFYLSADTF